MKKKRSLTYVFGISLGITLATVVAAMVLLILASVYINYTQLQRDNRTTLSVMENNLQTEMQMVSDTVRNIYLEDVNYSTLALTDYSGSQKVGAMYDLQNIIRNAVPPFGAILIFDRDGDVSMYSYGNEYPPENIPSRLKFNETYREYIYSADPETFAKWHFTVVDSRPLLSDTYRLGDLYVSAFIDLHYGAQYYNKTLASGLQQIVFHNGEDILTGGDYLRSENISREDIVRENSGFFDRLLSGYIIQNIEVGDIDSGICLCGIFQFSYLWGYSWVFIVIAFAVALLIAIMFVINFRNLKKMTLYPLQQIAAATECLENKKTVEFPTDVPGNIEELQKINGALDGLLRQKIQLDEENIRKEREIDHARLQYYQLQTRSHFFVNCLKSLYSMLENKEYERMQRMILAFSSHLRYIFQDNLLLVTLKAELEEVNDYYNIVQMDRSMPILLSKSVDEKLLEYKVPPLLVQTFLENSVKYNGKQEILRCSVEIDEIELEDNRMMRIRFCDDGAGYTKEMLEKLNQSEKGIYEKDHVGISNLKRRIELIYGKGYQAAFFNLPSGGACSLICIPLKK